MQRWHWLHYKLYKSATKVQRYHTSYHIYKFRLKCNAGIVNLFKTSLETDFSLLNHPNEVEWLFSQYMYERHSKWRCCINLYLFSPKMGFWELREYSHLFESSLEADFDLGGHPNEVGWLFSHYMYERQSKWIYSNNLDLFSPKMLSWELTEYSLLFETSLEADFDLGCHPNEVRGLFLILGGRST